MSYFQLQEMSKVSSDLETKYSQGFGTKILKRYLSEDLGGGYSWEK